MTGPALMVGARSIEQSGPKLSMPLAADDKLDPVVPPWDDARILITARVAPMWTHHTEQLADGRGLRIAISLDSKPIAYSEVLRHWQHDAAFRSFFIRLLADAPFSAFRWETPAVTSATV